MQVAGTLEAVAEVEAVPELAAPVATDIDPAAEVVAQEEIEESVDHLKDMPRQPEDDEGTLPYLYPIESDKKLLILTRLLHLDLLPRGDAMMMVMVMMQETKQQALKLWITKLLRVLKRIEVACFTRLG